MASDVAATFVELAHSLPRNMSIYQVKRLDDASYDWSSYDKQSPADAALALLTDIVGLRRSKVFIGTGSSNIGVLLWTLRDQQQISISVDIPFGQKQG